MRVTGIMSRHPLELITSCLLVVTGCYLVLVHSTESPSLKNAKGSSMTTLSIIGGPSPGLGRGEDSSERGMKLFLKQIVLEAPSTRSSVGILSKDLLLRASKLQSSLLSVNVSSAVSNDVFSFESCLGEESASKKLNVGTRCALISPLSAWKADKPLDKALVADPNVLQTLSAQEWDSDSLQAMLKDVQVSSNNQVQGASAIVLSFLFDITDPKDALLATEWESRIDNLESDLWVSASFMSKKHLLELEWTDVIHYVEVLRL